MLYNLDLLNGIKDAMVEKQMTLSVAESVTSGHLQAAFSAATEASRFFQGGITVYNAGQKCRHLNIEPIYALKEDCVSENVASQMALEVNKLFLSDIGIGITGYASVVPETGIHELYAFFAIARQNRVVLTKKIMSTKNDSVAAQLDYTQQVVSCFSEWFVHTN